MYSWSEIEKALKAGPKEKLSGALNDVLAYLQMHKKVPGWKISLAKDELSKGLAGLTDEEAKDLITVIRTRISEK